MGDPGQPRRRRRLPAVRRRLAELGTFGTVGAACLVVDMAVFQVLYSHVGAGAVTSKLGAATVSTTVAFLGHRYATFARRAHSGLRREYVRFTVVNAGTLVLSLGIIALVRYPLAQDEGLVLQAANVVAIAMGTAVRYLIYRCWVFPAAAPASGPPPALAATDA